MTSRSAPDPHVLRVTFDRVPELYDRARPVAPPEVFDDLVALGGLAPGSRLLEIGCGTGQATIPLAERGFAVTAVELGPQMAAVARQNLAAFPDVQVVTAGFEEWDAAGETFDGVVSFNAFHWIDPDVRFAKPAALLRDGGSLGVFGSRFVVSDDSDPAWVALDDDYVEITGRHEPRMHVSELRDRSDEFTAEGLFATPHVRRYDWNVTYDADAYVALLATLSWYSTLEDDVRRELFERLAARICEAPGGTITPTRAAVLYVATRT
jgi:SAM-dependent methyltransferase